MTAFGDDKRREYEFGDVLVFLGFDVAVEAARAEGQLAAELGWLDTHRRYVIVDATAVRTGGERFEFVKTPLALQDDQGRIFKPAAHQTRSLRRQQGVEGDPAPGGSSHDPLVCDPIEPLAELVVPVFGRHRSGALEDSSGSLGGGLRDV